MKQINNPIKFDDELRNVQRVLSLPNLSYEERLIHTSKMYQLEDVIRKLKNKTYGYCDICNRPIPRERLDRYPDVTTCVTCKSKLEKKVIYAKT